MSPPTIPALAVERLTVTRFRCYAEARLRPGRGPVVITGPNGAGKTNLLEAVSLLVPGRGLRGARLADLRRFADGDADGEDRGWAVAADVGTPSGTITIGTGVEPTRADAPHERERHERERRVVRIDGQPSRGQTALADHVWAVWLTPQMDRLFLEGAATRRRFIDRLVFGFDPAHAGRISRYEHGLRERATLLRDGRGDDAWLGALEDQMATTGIAIAAARRDVVARLSRVAVGGMGPFPGAHLAMRGVVEAWIEEGPALDAEDRFRETLSRYRNEDAAQGGARVGPHRADLEVVHAPKRVTAALCSTGEQKALLIAITLANGRLLTAERGAAPLMLLDEVAAHLDRQRREALFEALIALGAQVWLTGTEPAFFEPLGQVATRFNVMDAHIRQEA